MGVQCVNKGRDEIVTNGRGGAVRRDALYNDDKYNIHIFISYRVVCKNYNGGLISHSLLDMYIEINVVYSIY